MHVGLLLKVSLLRIVSRGILLKIVGGGVYDKLFVRLSFFGDSLK